MGKTGHGNWAIWMAMSMLLSLLSVNVRAQPGFLSISCGAKRNHTDENNITWVTDDNYIDVGKTGDIGDASQRAYGSYLHTLRFFPKPLNKSCYQLPVIPNVPYLLRIWFAIGNYSGFQNLPEFAVSVETRGFLTYTGGRQQSKNPSGFELILVSSASVLYICLIRTSETDDPFINAIELRTLKNGMYGQTKPGTALYILSRKDVGGNLLLRSLDNNYLTGPLPNFSNLTLLETLHLQNNHFSGNVPDWLSQLKNLKELFMENNNFSGVIPAQLIGKPSLKLKYSGNHYLCLRMHKEKCIQSIQETKNNSRKDKMIVVFKITISGALIIALALTVGIAVYWKKFRTKQRLNEDSPMIVVPNRTISRAFSLEEIMAATRNFNEKIGQGGFGSVFFGKLPEGQDIAVKVLSLFSRQGVHQFQNEVDLLSRVHHKNLVSLLGYCNESGEVMLIYEHMSGGSLRDHLYGTSAEIYQHNWKTRLRIALDAAQDFGVSKITIDGETTHVTTTVKGTAGYLDPEYFRTDKLTEKSDVYGFGVVLLEIICSRPPINANLPDDHEELNLIQWATPYVEMHDCVGEIAVIIDKRLGGNYSMKSISAVAKLAVRCLKGRPSSRPSVSEVVAELEDAMAHENNGCLPVSKGIGSQYGELQAAADSAWADSSEPKHMEWSDNSSNLPQVGR